MVSKFHYCLIVAVFILFIQQIITSFRVLSKYRHTAVSGSASHAKAGNTDDKPLNILIIYPDDWRHDSIGSAGTDIVKTPFLDRLAKSGIRFTHNCVTTSICWVSRATFFTGQYLSRHKSQYLRDPVFCAEGKWNQTWPSLLQKAGYYVAHIGKWQFHNMNEMKNYFDWVDMHEGSHWYGKTHATDRAKEGVFKFLKDRPKDQPFALTVAFYPPKAIGDGDKQYFPKDEKMYENETVMEPFDMKGTWKLLPNFFTEKNEARTRWRQRFGAFERFQESMKNYYALINDVDDAVGKILKRLEEEEIMNETMIIFTTDNGYFLGEHGLSGKWYPYQESIRVPLIIWDPRMSQNDQGTLDDSFTLNIDLASTILGAANLKQHPRMQGRDIADIYLKPGTRKIWREEFYYEHHLANFGENSIPQSSALVRKDFKYIKWPLQEVEQIFDLYNDPLEHKDIANEAEYSQLLDEMRTRYDELALSVI